MIVHNDKFKLFIIDWLYIESYSRMEYSWLYIIILWFYIMIDYYLKKNKKKEHPIKGTPINTTEQELQQMQ